MMALAAYSETRVRQSEVLQLLLLDGLYGHSGSQHIIFQGGTALRWVYGGPRFSEDLDFVTHLPPERIQPILEAVFTKVSRACVAQFGAGESERQTKAGRENAQKMVLVYRPVSQRERIAVKLEFESLRPNRQPAFQKVVLKDLPQVSRLIAAGHLFIPYSSAIVLVETLAEILTDKIRALYERPYLKGRDIFDLWWIMSQMQTTVDWRMLENKLTLYQVPFQPARRIDYFQARESLPEIESALRSDLSRFIAPSILAAYQEDAFKPFMLTLQQLSAELEVQDFRRTYWK
jgi:predicted nucleotidyltransferase component of viral defense system